MAIDNKDKKVLNVPHLRFPEFTEEWERCKVSELLDFYSTNSLCWEQLENETNTVQNLHYGLIHVGLPTMVDLNREEEEPIDIKAVMAEIKELEAKRAELDKEIEVYLKELGLVE